jgi:hypothetical protein
MMSKYAFRLNHHHVPLILGNIVDAEGILEHTAGRFFAISKINHGNAVGEDFPLQYVSPLRCK